MKIDYMLDYFKDLMIYAAWADAEFFRAWEPLSNIHEDHQLRLLTNHIIAVQLAFLKFMKEEPVEHPGPDDALPEFTVLRQRAVQNHLEWQEFLAEIVPADLQKPIRVPWFAGSSVQPNYAEGITQVILHTQHHRAQNMAKLRQLGCDKKILDYISWVLRGRPHPLWNS